MRKIATALALATGIALTAGAIATPALADVDFRFGDDIAHRKADILSEGTRMSAELFALKEHAGKPLVHRFDAPLRIERDDAVAQMLQQIVESLTPNRFAAGGLCDFECGIERGAYRCA